MHVSTFSVAPVVVAVLAWLRFRFVRRRDNDYKATILDSLPAHVALVDGGGSIIEVNASWRAFADGNAMRGGYGVGLDYLAVCDGARGAGADEAAAVAAGLRAVLAGQAANFTLEYPCHAPDRQRWFQMSVTPLAHHHTRGAVVMHIDITARRLAEDALRASELRFRQMADNISDVFFLELPDHQEVVYISPAYETIWGRSCASLYADAASWADAVHPDDRVHVMSELAAGRCHGFDYQFRILRPDGTQRWIHTRGYPIYDATGKLYRTAGVCSDITLRKQVEHDLHMLNGRLEHRVQERTAELEVRLRANLALADSLNQANRLLQEEILERQRAQQAELASEQAMQAKAAQSNRLEAIGTLSAGIAHDFNSILGIINGYAELLQITVRQLPGGMEKLDHIIQACFRARDLIQRLLAFARQIPVDPVELEAVSLLREALDMIRVTLPDGIEVRFNSALAQAPMVADPMQLHQLMMNLCNNAADAMNGAGVLDVRITAAAPGPGQRFTLIVADTGCGMSPETQQRIFDPFYTSKSPGKGSGLGLSVVYGIVAELGGEIVLHSTLGVGSRFDVVLPLGAPAAKPLPQPG